MQTKNKFMPVIAIALMTMFLGVINAAAQIGSTGDPTVRIVLPERFRVLTNQYFDLRIEAENLRSPSARMSVIVRNEVGDETLQLAGATENTTNNDNSSTLDKATTYRRVFFPTSGTKTITAILVDGRSVYGVITQVTVQNFTLVGQKSIVLYIGDAMGTAYRDAGRIVAQSTENRFREGWFDELQQMDRMPVTGMAMTYGSDAISPDSANTASAWSNGNKTVNGALNTFPDNNDFKYSSANVQGTKQFALDNPRVETLWQYLRRRHGYKTGIVSTADITDATPAGEGAHTITRSLGYDIAKQYVDGSINTGLQFDVIMGGGLERFISRTASNSGDTRNLVTDLQGMGYTYVQNRTELNAISNPSAPNKLIGLFRTGNMNVAYDKLGLVRPADEPAPNFGGFNDQPFLDEMTDKAIAALSSGNAPFILMVEGASIDKQSHPNHFAGQNWDTIELDKSIGIGRTYLNSGALTQANTLLITTADHDQSMQIINTIDTTVPSFLQNVRSPLGYPNPGRVAGETDGFPDYMDANNDRYPENNNVFKLGVGYRTGNHTGSSVPVTAEGAGALLFFGYYDQTDLFFKMGKILSMNTAPLDQPLRFKLQNDVPYPVLLPQLRGEADGDVKILKNAPMRNQQIAMPDDHGDSNSEAESEFSLHSK